MSINLLNNFRSENEILVPVFQPVRDSLQERRSYIYSGREYCYISSREQNISLSSEESQIRNITNR